MPKKEPFIATVFLEQGSNLKALWAELSTHISAATGLAPVHVHPSQDCVVILIEGEYPAIVKALQKACQQHDDRWLLARVCTPCGASGLARADGWTRSRSIGPGLGD